MEARGPDAPRLRPEMASRKLLVLDFVRDYIARWHASPSYGEIAAGVGISATRAKQLVKALAREGQLLRKPGPRGLSLPEDRDEALRLLEDLGYIALAPDCPNPTLQVPPVLDYIPDAKGDGHDTRPKRLGRAASRKSRRRKRAPKSEPSGPEAMGSQGARHRPDA